MLGEDAREDGDAVPLVAYPRSAEAGQGKGKCAINGNFRSRDWNESHRLVRIRFAIDSTRDNKQLSGATETRRNGRVPIILKFFFVFFFNPLFHQSRSCPNDAIIS